MEIKLLGKKALVGGSSSGIGKAIALQLARCGVEVTLMSGTEERLKSTILELDTSYGQNHGYLVTDFSDYSAHKKTMTNFFAHHTVDILVNNTNGPHAGDIESKQEADYQQAFELLF